MENKTDIIFENKNINRVYPDKYINIKIIKFNPKSTKINLSQKYTKIFNFILFEIIFLLLPNKIRAINLIKIKVNKIGYNQIFSDEYTGSMPDRIIFNERPLLIINKIIYVQSLNNLISLEWDDFFNNFAFMFSNLTSITYANMNFELNNNCNMSYMFYNCYNLEEFRYETTNNDESYNNIDMSKMFYNCSLLEFFIFHQLNLNLNNVNASHMFYNCQSLKTILFYNNIETNDMKGMFYNCISLEEINLEKIKSSIEIDISYMFYNCNKLTTFISNSNSIKIKEMKYMFYNCYSIKTININFISSSSAINMSYLFYNCNNLEEIQGSFENLLISDTIKMFYNCTSLISLNFNPKKVNPNINNLINMTKMFYNCEKLNNIIITFSGNNGGGLISYFFPNDLSYIFYNCVSLISIILNYFKTDNVKEISYMMFNCKKLTYFSILNSNFLNPLITSMKGIFQNCESLISLNLYKFYTPNVEIMWDMFKGCKSLQTLDLSNFETSKVIDMESMFEGCESLISLSLINFNTHNVRYMNKMFSGCISLQSLYFNYISSESLGTMHQMFYNCKSLKYLNLFLLTEKTQTFFEMFEGTSNNFALCIKENENIPNIFKEILKKENVMRDCSENCYGLGNQRAPIPEKKICCPNFKYNGNCYDKCPQRTKVINEFKKCENFSCEHNYNYIQNDCLSYIPDGYYINDTELKTIDKCHENCKTCIKGPTKEKANCLICKENLRYYYLGNCFDSCDYYYDDPVILECRCVTEECSRCSEESLEQNLCISCAGGYYTKENDILNTNEFVKCYKDPPKYYLKYNIYGIGKYLECYSSCDKCYGPGDVQFHNCLVCDSNHTFEIIKNRNGHKAKNCYENCTYYYYFDNNEYFCSETKQCPPPFNFIIAGTKQCIKSCSETEGYFKKFRNYCYKECPSVISEQSEDNQNLCNAICPYDFPFELIESQMCVSTCSIISRSKKLCITNHFEDRTNLELQELIYDDISKDLIRTTFNYSIITENNPIVINENNTIYEIITSTNKNQNKKTSKIDFGNCEYILKNYYGIEHNESLIFLKMDTFTEGKTGPTSIYEVFYPLNNKERLVKLSLTPCEGEKISLLYSMELSDPELYDKKSPVYSDICFRYSIKGGVDATLGDMQRDYSNKNKSLCEEDCEYNGYDEENKFFKCDCKMKQNLPKISEIKDDKSKLYSFDEIKKLANFDVLRCTNLIASKKGLIKNIGFYSFIPTFLAYIVCIIMFYKKENKTIKGNIDKLVYAKKVIYKQQLERLENGSEFYLKPKIIIKRKIPKESAFISYLKDFNGKPNLLKNDIINNINIKSNQIKYVRIKERHFRAKKEIKEKTTEVDNLKENLSSNRSDREELFNKYEDKIDVNDIIIINRKNVKNAPPIKNQNKLNNTKEEKNISSNQDENENNKVNEIMKFNDRELNDLEFKKALKYDNRSFWQFYLSLLRTEHILMKVSNSRDYNSRAIKIYLCLYNFGLSFTINALFFDDETIEQIFADAGKFNFIYQIPQIIYSSIISFFFGIIIDILALSEENVLALKNEKVSKNMTNNAKKLSIILQIKFSYFFILSFIFMLMFWYYITSFCAVYSNTQYHLIKDTIIGFFTSLLNPFLFKLIPGLFRVYGLRHKNYFIYKFSKILEMFC